MEASEESLEKGEVEENVQRVTVRHGCVGLTAEVWDVHELTPEDREALDEALWDIINTDMLGVLQDIKAIEMIPPPKGHPASGRV